jgi:hypothetical protein
MRKCFALIFILIARLAGGCEWDYPIWMIRTKTADPLYRFTKGNKAGYINQAGKIVIPPSFSFFQNHGGEFHSGFLKNDYWTIGEEFFIDARGKAVFPKDRFGRIGRFSEGLVPARPYGVRLWGFMNSAGRFVIPPKIHADNVRSFREGLAAIEVDHKTGYINRSGRIVITPSFVDAGPFGGGFARVVVEGPCLYKTNDGPCSEPVVLPDYEPPSFFNAQKAQSGIKACRFSFIDKTGKTITKQTFDDADAFSEGLAAVKVDKLWGYINQTGKVIIPPQFISARPFSDGRALVEKNKSELEYIDITGRTAIPLRFNCADTFSEGLAAVTTDDGSYIYIDRSGKQAIPARFASASHFYKGLAHVKLLRNENMYAYINRWGYHVFSYTP